MKRELIVAVACLYMASSTWADEGLSGHKMQTSGDLMRMCMAAAKGPALSVMCNNYINGYLDAVASGRHKGKFCFGKGDRERLPQAVAIWLAAHPDYKKQPSPEAMDQVLSEKFACKK